MFSPKRKEEVKVNLMGERKKKLLMYIVQRGITKIIQIGTNSFRFCLHLKKKDFSNKTVTVFTHFFHWI